MKILSRIKCGYAQTSSIQGQAMGVFRLHFTVFQEDLTHFFAVDDNSGTLY
jgi:hypothetical protein